MNRRQLLAYEKLEDCTNSLNEVFTVGEVVNVENDFGEIEIDKIKYPFSIMSNQVVAWLENKGSYLAERVNKATED